VNDSGHVFLAIIAVSVLLMAILQLGAVLFLAGYAKRLMRITEDLQREITPVIAKVSAVADEAQRAASLATKQVERVDLLVGDVTRRIQDTMSTLQSVVTGPVRQGSVLVSALRGMLTALLTSRPPGRVERDEGEDALFVG
jgi:hypothetical protein